MGIQFSINGHILGYYLENILLQFHDQDNN